jgi:uncharacterized protein (DUF1330 family)
MATPVYMVAMIDVKDYQAYAEQYGMPVGKMFADAGAEILVATTEPDVLEGSWPGNWTVIVKVPSAEIARALYESDEYAPFKKARVDQLANETHFAVLPGLSPGG